MRTIKGAAQLLLAVIALACAMVFCVMLALRSVIVMLWDLADGFLRAAFNTELHEFFKAKSK